MTNRSCLAAILITFSAIAGLPVSAQGIPGAVGGCFAGQQLQNAMLDTLVREHIPVTIKFSDGRFAQGQIEAHDKSVILLKNTVTTMIYKNSITEVVPARPVNLPPQEC